jgi:glycerol-3-phosphate acyltransferase PlsY
VTVDALKYLAVIITAYLVGAIPFGILISRLAKGIDIRRYGSGKIGATNVIRIVGSRAGLISMVLDVAKGSVSVLFAWLLLQTHAAQVAAGAAAVVGHNWPVYIRFKGGRGVAVFVGGLFAMYWPVGLATGAVVLGLGVLTRYMSLGSIAGIAVAIVAMAVLVIIEEQPVECLIYAAAVGCLVLYEHRDNIRRLRAGVELRLSGGSEAGEDAVRGEEADRRGKAESRGLDRRSD